MSLFSFHVCHDLGTFLFIFLGTLFKEAKIHGCRLVDHGLLKFGLEVFFQCLMLIPSKSRVWMLGFYPCPMLGANSKQPWFLIPRFYFIFSMQTLCAYSRSYPFCFVLFLFPKHKSQGKFPLRLVLHQFCYSLYSIVNSKLSCFLLHIECNSE